MEPQRQLFVYHDQIEFTLTDDLRNEVLALHFLLALSGRAHESFAAWEFFVQFPADCSCKCHAFSCTALPLSVSTY